VREGLYSYTRQHLRQWLADNRSGAADSLITYGNRNNGAPRLGAERRTVWISGPIPWEATVEPFHGIGYIK
jgi:hypothetical protein